MRQRLAIVLVVAVLPVAARVLGQEVPKPAEGDFKVSGFRFSSGEVLPSLNLHYATYGTPARDTLGHVTNAVMILHGTGGSGQQFVNARFAGVLFGPGQLLDTSRYFIILPDSIGHGRSSKPSDGLHARFPALRLRRHGDGPASAAHRGAQG